MILTTSDALESAISICKDGVNLSEISRTISRIASQKGYNISPDFNGHGIGETFHQLPYIQHNIDYIEEEDENVMKEGMTFTIEPILMQGEIFTNIMEDGWTAKTEDGGIFLLSL